MLLKKHHLISLNLLIIISFAILSVVSFVLVLKTKTLFGAWDIQFHFRRILALMQSIYHGNLLPQFDFNYFHGALDMVMYPSFNLYPIIIISHFMKFGAISIYVWFVFNTFIALLISFYSSYSTCHFWLTSYVFAILYSMSGFLFALYVSNMDLGAISAYTVLPLVIFGFINFLKDQNRWIEFSTGVSLLIMSHVLSTLIGLMFIFILGLININRLRRYHIKNLIRPIILTVCITSIYWMPFIYMMVINHGNIQAPELMPLQGFGVKAFLRASFNPFPNYFGLNIFAVCTVILAAFYYVDFDRITKQLYILSCLMLVSCSDLVPWGLITKHFPMINILQKIYRLFIIPQLLLLFIFALIITKYLSTRGWLSLLVILVMMTIQIYGQAAFVNQSIPYPLFNQYYLIKHPYDQLSRKPNYKMSTGSQIQAMASRVSYKNDYFPKSLTANQLNAVHNNQVDYDHQITHLFHRGYNHYEFMTHRDASKVKLPFVLFKGQRVQIKIDGRPYKISNDRNQMVIRNLPQGHHSLQLITENKRLLMILSFIMLLLGIAIYLKEILERTVFI